VLEEKGILDAPGFEDSCLIYEAGMKVRICESSYKNIKITTPEDLVMAEEIVKEFNNATL
jgi:2-C-methyl-D-erythritol 4-phosphate cytidylyltransferase